MDSWLIEARDAVAREAGLEPSELDLSESEVEALLLVARTAAHDSGDRTNAPLLCYLLGLARRSGVELERLAAAVPPSTS